MPATAISRPLLLGLPLLALTACAPVGPNHQTPAMSLPASFSQGGVEWRRQSVADQPKPRAWWRMFHDSTLNQLVERALAMNLEVSAASARLRQARETSKQARSMFFPGVNLGATAERSKFRFRGQQGGAMLNTTVSVPVELSYEVDVWGKVRRQVESARASEGAAAETLNALKLSVAGEVAQTYWALRAVDANRAMLDRSLEVRRKGLGLLTKQRDTGSLSGLDLARAETEVAAAASDRIQLDQTRAELVNALAVLTGTMPTGSSVTENPDLPQPPTVPLSVPSALLRQRPDIRAAEHRVAAANANIGVATAAFYPTLSLGASSGYDAARIGDLINASALVWSIGSKAMVPLTGQKWLKAQQAAAVAAHEAAGAEYRQTVLEAIREVEDAMQGTAILAHRQTAQDQALTAARKAFDLAAKRHQSGLVSFLEVVDAERTLLEAERTANAIRAERLALAVSLAKALGGEW